MTALAHFLCAYVKTGPKRPVVAVKGILYKLKYLQCFNSLTSVQYSHSAWFLDGRTSILVAGWDLGCGTGYLLMGYKLLVNGNNYQNTELRV